MITLIIVIIMCLESALPLRLDVGLYIIRLHMCLDGMLGCKVLWYIVYDICCMITVIELDKYPGKWPPISLFRF